MKLSAAELEAAFGKLLAALGRGLDEAGASIATLRLRDARRGASQPHGHAGTRAADFYVVEVP